MTNVKFKSANCRPQNSGVSSSPLNAFINDFINGDFLSSELKKTTKSVFNNLSGYPAVNIKELENSFDIELIAPGFEKNDFSIEIDADKLIVKGEKAAVAAQQTESKENIQESVEKQVHTPVFLRKEFVVNNFSRNFTLPENVDLEAINANYANGILTVTIPKKELPVKVVRTVKIA